MRFPTIILCALALAQTTPPVPAASALSMSNAGWTLKIDPSSGALIEIRNARDPQSFNFLREPGRWEQRTWVAGTSSAAAMQGGQWGLVETAQTGLLHAAQVRQISPDVVESEYTSAFLTVTVRRELDPQAGTLRETYTFKNTGMLELALPSGALAISAPLSDQYPDAQRSLAARCHAHLWMGGSSAWINAMRMDATPPHPGLVVTDGALDSYSQRGGTLGDRGVFLPHPAAMKIPGGQSRSLSWTLFWHDGWDDFFAKAQNLSAHFVRLEAKRYTVVAGEPIEVTATGSARALQDELLLVNGKQASEWDSVSGKVWATIHTPPGKYGEVRIELLTGPKHEHRTWLVVNVVPSPPDLIRSRVEFIVRKQQRRAPGDPLDGAYLPYDNETERQVYEARPADHNAGRECVGMGILCAMYLPLCKDAAFRAELAGSLARYSAFVTRELEGDDGTVYSGIGRTNGERLYNFPWVARFHLAMSRAAGESEPGGSKLGGSKSEHLDRFMRVVRRFYARGGAAFYPIGMPVREGLETLARAGVSRASDYAELLEKFRAHADALIKTGKNYPPSEVNYEQSIAAPAVQFLLEFYHATRERKYLEGAREQMPLVEAFNGRQPDHHFHEIAIRHWDDYWFGKLRLYGDTFPHYWSCVTGLAYAYHAKTPDVENDAAWMRRAEAAIHGNLSLFTPDGRGSAAHVYPHSANGVRAARNDPWANDQDWALVHLLLLGELSGASE